MAGEWKPLLPTSENKIIETELHNFAALSEVEDLDIEHH